MLHWPSWTVDKDQTHASQLNEKTCYCEVCPHDRDVAVSQKKDHFSFHCLLLWMRMIFWDIMWTFNYLLIFNHNHVLFWFGFFCLNLTNRDWRWGREVKKMLNGIGSNASHTWYSCVAVPPSLSYLLIRMLERVIVAQWDFHIMQYVCVLPFAKESISML